ncbi:MAG: UTP--glucose-1-phosphate uridylyltransferase [Candidatus Omnitrophica bacterium]|nr:UTP--glucose-1-phosphate uridylyltransferase [Candidatus Omnitrophota bacterium]
MSIHQIRKSLFSKVLSIFINIAFLFNFILPPGVAQAQVSIGALLNLPALGSMVSVSPRYVPPIIIGVTINPNDPLKFDFLIDSGDDALTGEPLKEEGRKLVKYFLTSLTVPENEQWVNLSPYEGGRIIPAGLGQTEMGIDLLAQDYLLKQIMSSLMYPEEEMGRAFWDRVYSQARERFGTTEIPINTFNKVWIIPERAVVYEHENTAFVGERRLKVMLEEDYLALSENVRSDKFGTKALEQTKIEDVSGVTSKIVREILIPELEKEVNEGKNFAQLRQIFNSMILATWYKKSLKESLLGQVYVDQNKIKGVDTEDPSVKDQLYQQYLESFKIGVYNYIKEEYDPSTQMLIPRKYFSGGIRTITPRKVETEPLKTLPLSRQTDVLDGESRPGRISRLDVGIVENGADSQIRQVEKPSSSPLEVDFVRLQEVMDQKGLDTPSQAYYRTLVKRHLNLKNGVSQEKPLIIAPKNREGGNFIPSADLTEEERRTIIGVSDYNDIIREIVQQPNKTAYDLILANLDAGLGSSIERLEYLLSEFNRDTLGAKGTDLAFQIGDNKISIAELKLMQLIIELQDKNIYKNVQKVKFQPVVNVESQPHYVNLLNKQVFAGLQLNSEYQSGKIITYQQLLEKLNVTIEYRDTPFYPGLTPGTVKLEPTIAYNGSGSHGEHGFKYLNDTLDAPIKERPEILAFYNGDGPNNTPDHHIVEWMVKNNVPIVMLSTTKTGLDRKGGQIGVEFLDNRDNTPGKVKIRMLEHGSAKSNGQREIFEKVGLGLEGSIGEKGKQYFNTNIALINYSLIGKILREVLQDVFSGNREEFYEIIQPDLISGEKKGYIQLEGPIGTVFLNLHNFMETNRYNESEKSRNINKIFQKYNVDRILRIVNIEAENRTKFFTPVKFAVDYWLMAQTNFFEVDQTTWTLKNTKAGQVPPLIDVQGSDAEDNFYNNVTTWTEGFGRTDVNNLDSLTIKGRVSIKESRMEGNISVVNNLPGVTVRLNDLLRPDNAIPYNIESGEMRVDAGRLIIKDLKLTIGNTLPAPIPESEKTPVTPTASSSPMILVVEDDGDTALTIEGKLKLAGYEVVVASNGKEALDVLNQRTDISQVLTDYQMPEMDGVKLVQEIKKQQIPIPIMMHTMGSIENIKRKLNGIDVPVFNKFQLDRVIAEVKKNVAPAQGQTRIEETPLTPQKPGSDKLGGIDLNPALFDLQIKRDGNGVPLPLPQQPIGNMRIEGFAPIILNVTPVPNLPLFLGIADTQEEEFKNLSFDYRSDDIWAKNEDIQQLSENLLTAASLN